MSMGVMDTPVNQSRAVCLLEAKKSLGYEAPCLLPRSVLVLLCHLFTPTPTPTLLGKLKTFTPAVKVWVHACVSLEY